MTSSRILCVHENGSVLQELQEALAKTGWDVVLANDGLHAAQILEREHVGGIVLSFDIEGPDGGALRNQIRHLCPEMPLLLFSSMDEIRGLPLHVFSAYLQHEGVATLTGMV
jgi:DNA-binding NtrC family response regulator